MEGRLGPALLRDLVLYRRQLLLHFRLARFSARLAAGGWIVMLYIAAPDLLQVLVAASAGPVDAILQRTLLVVILVVVFGLEELGGLQDFGDDRPVVPSGFPEVRPGLLGFLFLFVAVIEDRRPVLLTAVHELPASVGRINLLPEFIQQLGIRYPGRVIRDFHGFEVALFRVVLVRRFRAVTADVAGHHLDDPRKLLERCHAPEAPSGERRFLVFCNGIRTRAEQREQTESRQRIQGQKFHDSTSLPRHIDHI